MAASMEEDRLQAVILADSFNDRFKPLTLTKPRVCRHSAHEIKPNQMLCLVLTAHMQRAIVRLDTGEFVPIGRPRSVRGMQISCGRDQGSDRVSSGQFMVACQK